MIKVTLHGKSSQEISKIVWELKNFGLMINKDYDYTYVPKSYIHEYDHDMEIYTSTTEIPKHTIFTFYDDKLASWFTILYAI